MNIGMFVPIMFGGLLMKKWGCKTAGDSGLPDSSHQLPAVLRPNAFHV